MPVPTALTIGNFDGVHAGHAALVQAARRAVGSSGRVVALTFEPHPAALLRPHAVPPRLSSPEQRREWLREAGADEVDVLPASLALFEQSPQRFIADIVDHHHPQVIVEGADFRFGRGRSGTIVTLEELGRDHGFEVVVPPTVEVVLGDQSVVRVSSSLVRWLVRRGRMADARRCLGRFYEVIGPVVRGDQRGRRMGIPTANVRHGDQVLPADGVYAGTALLPDGRRLAAAISVGTKPTFGTAPRTCEAHLLDFDGPADDYGWIIRIRVIAWLRDQLTYPSLAALTAQIERDLVHTRQAVAAAPESGVVAHGGT